MRDESYASLHREEERKLEEEEEKVDLSRAFKFDYLKMGKDLDLKL